MYQTYIALSLGVLVTGCSSLFAGRLGGLGATAGWMIGTAYFVMPPVFSFHIERITDWIALAAFASVGLALVKNAPNGTMHSNEERLFLMASDHADLGEVLREVSDQLKDPRVDPYTPPICPLHCTHGDAVRVLSKTMMEALADPGVQRISVQLASLPGRDLLFVTACRVWPLPEQRAIMIGAGTIGTDKSVFEGEFGQVYRITL